MTKVLILDQSKSVRNTLQERLKFEGYTTESASELDSAAELCRNQNIDLVLADDHFTDLQQTLSDTPFVVISSKGSIDSAVEALHHGALDYLTRPIDMNRLLRVVREASAPPSDEEIKARTTPRARRSSKNICSESTMVGHSAQIERLRTLIDKVAPSDARVMIMGENGTGKELVARSLHNKSTRASAPFVEVNCAAIPSELIESELFGHEKGAFTSAIKQRKGKFEQASCGTLFMDEIGDMSLSAQAKVLRALQEHRISRVGSDRDIDVDVRIIAATNKNLKEEIAQGRFREDLYHRLSVIVMKVAPLRERNEDIPELVEHFLEIICHEHNTPKKSISAEALSRLQAMSWSGNIRELRNVIERLIILSGSTIELEDIINYCEC